MKSVLRIIRLLPGYRLRLISVLSVSAGVAAIGAATPFLFRHVVEVLAARPDPKPLATSLIATFAVFVVFRLSLIGLGFLQHRQSAALWLDNVGSLRKRIFDDLSALSMGYYETSRTGDVMDRFAAIVPVTHWLRELVEGALATALLLVFSVAALLMISPWAGLVMAAAAPLNLYGAWRGLTATRSHRRTWQKLGGRMSAILNETLSQIATIRAFGGEARQARLFGQAHGDWGRTRIEEWRIDRRWHTALLTLNGLALTLVTGLILTDAWRGRASGGDVLLVLTLALGAVAALQPISRMINAAGDVEGSAERLVELLDAGRAAPERPDAANIIGIGEIRFDRVSFTYPGQDRPALDAVSFTLTTGRTTALVGPSGSGKTTLVKLLLRLYEPDTGRILVDGVDVRDISRASLRARMGMVLQDVALFDDTIAGNIAFSQADATREQVEQAARLAQADGFIRRLPDGYDTPVGERGVRLSGGERQRLAVARALLRDPDIVILDEATSALDAESERLVQAGLDRLRRNRTALVVAHRLSTIAAADLILVMQDGRIVEYGPHAALLGQGGLYTRLHSIQFDRSKAAS
ncbi:ABC transporter ATP-binding protein [Brevundimonas sp. VNH65]|uniref:ABC transporter ATP-binding protein n=1 Tax=Brevundimonas sp. VNH65 TaxID=3400917 RepID=UPI003C08EC48